MHCCPLTPSSVSSGSSFYFIHRTDKLPEQLLLYSAHLSFILITLCSSSITNFSTLIFPPLLNFSSGSNLFLVAINIKLSLSCKLYILTTAQIPMLHHINLFVPIFKALHYFYCPQLFLSFSTSSLTSPLTSSFVVSKLFSLKLHKVFISYT